MTEPNDTLSIYSIPYTDLQKVPHTVKKYQRCPQEKEGLEKTMSRRREAR